jgi:hypothetical protein
MPDATIPAPFEAYSGEKPYLFAAYAHSDAVKVFAILGFLHELGFRAWYDEGIDPGNEWADDIARRLASCSAFLAFISGSSIASRNVRNEINFALTRQKPVLVVHVEETILPPGLELQIGSLQAILMYRMSDDTFRSKLVRSLDPSLRELAGREPDGRLGFHARPGAKTQDDLLSAFDETSLEVAQLRPLMDRIPLPKQSAFARLLLMFELVGTIQSPLRHESIEHMTYCQRIVKQIHECQTEAGEFQELIAPLREVLDGKVETVDFGEEVRKWRFAHKLSGKRLADMIANLGEEIVPVLVYSFLQLGSFDAVDGYYLAGNVQCDLSRHVLPRFRDPLVVYALMSYLREGSMAFDSTSMNVALSTLQRLLGSKQRLQIAYSIATGRQLEDDERKRDEDRKRYEEERRLRES